VSLVGAGILLLSGRDEPAKPDQSIPIVAEPQPAPQPQTTPEPDEVPAQAGDPIGDLIAALEPEPKVESVAKPVWRQNAMPAAPEDGRPMIAIVIDDVGLSADLATKAIALPGPVTLAFLPYAKNLPALTQQAHRAGHELMVHMPMEPGDASVDPGPHALRVGLGADELRQRIDWNLSQFDGYVGFNNHMGSRFTADRAGMKVVMAEARRRGLLFLDSRTTKDTKGRALAEAAGVPVIERQVFLDNKIEAAAIREQLQTAEKVARSKGAAVAIGHPHPATIETLKTWLAANKDFAVVPVSALVMRGVGTNGGHVDPVYSDQLGY